jgi:choline dehydrogenase-like flavoprotein
LNSFLDARAVPAGTTIETDLVIVGGGPAGISLALALADLPIRILLLESGGMDFEADTQKLYDGKETGVQYLPLDACRLRFLGGSTNHWGGWCRPYDESDFVVRSWVPHSGWPITRADLEPYFPRAQALVEAGPFVYDKPGGFSDAGEPIKLGDGGVYTSYFQFSKTKGGVLPTPFGKRYANELKQSRNLSLYLHANVTGVRLASDAGHLDHLDVATLSGNTFTVKPRYTVLAVGGAENARLLLASNDVMANGVGNVNDIVGRFFADNPVPRDTATMVLFDGAIPPFYPNGVNANGAHIRAMFAPTETFKRERHVLGSLTTVENHVELDAVGRAAVNATAAAFGIDASAAKAWSLGCGLEMAPDPERRFTLTGERDALGMPRLNLNMRISDSDFASYDETMKELGRQLLAAGTGMIHLNRESRESWLSVMDWGDHHLGTTRMHADPKHGVVDANQRVHGIPNLYVAGSSVFTTCGASNPTMNLVALTLRLADHLKDVLR